MENNAQRVPTPRLHSADPVPYRDAIRAARAGDRPLVDGEGHRLPLAQRYHLRPRLHPGPLLRQHELATREIPSRL